MVDPLDTLRSLMASHSPPLDALIVPSEDNHQSEYVSARDKRLEFVSKFTESAGLALVTMNEALLWTDGRYFLQATQQLSERWKLMPMGEDPPVETWIADNISNEGTVGIDPWCLSVETAQRYENAFSKNKQKLVQLSINLVDEIWKDRPPSDSLPVVVHPVEFTGRTVAEKLKDLREKLVTEKVYAIIITALDEVAWLYDIRGSDLAYSPVVHAYAIVTIDSAFFYVDKKKVTAEVKSYMAENGIDVREYGVVDSDVSLLESGQLHSSYTSKEVQNEAQDSFADSKIWIDPVSCCLALSCKLPSDRVFKQPSPLAHAKAIKSDWKKMNNGRGLSEHVVFDILSWLPVSSLLRFKSVCKDWYGLIESSSFITEHLRHSNNTEDALIAHGAEAEEEDPPHYNYFFMLIHGREFQNCSKLDHMQVLLPPKGSYDGTMIGDTSTTYRLVGSCDGIVCLRTSDAGNLALCNPAMRQIKYLPAAPSFPIPPLPDGFAVMGFGFDFKSNDYKIVRAVFCADEPGIGNYKKKIVEVYSKKANSWRTLDKKGASLPFKFLHKYPQATCKDGLCFWIGIGLDDTHKLISFDLNDEVFGMMSLPHGDLGTCGLDVLNDELIYMKGVESECCSSESGCTCDLDPGYKLFEIWMLGEFGIDGSWSKIYRIGPIFRKTQDWNIYYTPIRLSKNGEFVVLIADNSSALAQLGGELRLYNLKIQDDQLPLIHPPEYLTYELFHYTESLVSVIS